MYILWDMLIVESCLFLVSRVFTGVYVFGTDGSEKLKSDNNLSSEQTQDEKDKECTASMAKTFVVQEMYEAKMVSWLVYTSKPSILRSEFFSFLCV